MCRFCFGSLFFGLAFASLTFAFRSVPLSAWDFPSTGCRSGCRVDGELRRGAAVRLQRRRVLLCRPPTDHLPPGKNITVGVPLMPAPDALPMKSRGAGWINQCGNMQNNAGALSKASMQGGTTAVPLPPEFKEHSVDSYFIQRVRRTQ